ncbi:MAG: malonyl-ACP O-methyltransferase BioC [Nitrospirae bacterium]|nr:malonyl-ACP O-methyltransferase BioC [Nitrospirota bacterium]
MILRNDKIKSAFSRAAKTYDAHADIQKESAAGLVRLLGNINPASILEIGCATGNYTAMLAERFPQAPITSVDFSQTMADIAMTKLHEKSNVSFICHDAEKLLNETDKRYDLITSNAALQWFTDINNSIRNIAKLLEPHGIFIFSVFGPQTFNELSTVLGNIFCKKVSIPAHDFPEKEELLGILNAVFDSVVFEEVNVRREYNSAFELLDNIKKTGSTGGRPPLKLNRHLLAKMDEWFSRNYGKCAATYQLFFVTARNK